MGFVFFPENAVGLQGSGLRGLGFRVSDPKPHGSWHIRHVHIILVRFLAFRVYGFGNLHIHSPYNCYKIPILYIRL